MKKPGFETASKLFPGWSSTVMRRMLETPEKWDDDDIASVRRYLDTLEKKVEYELDPEFVKQLENKSTLPTDPTTKKLPTLVSYDIDDGRDSFLQVAEKIKKGEAKVSSMSMERDIMKGTSITFEVRVWNT